MSEDYDDNFMDFEDYSWSSFDFNYLCICYLFKKIRSSNGACLKNDMRNAEKEC